MSSLYLEPIPGSISEDAASVIGFIQQQRKAKQWSSRLIDWDKVKSSKNGSWKMRDSCKHGRWTNNNKMDSLSLEAKSIESWSSTWDKQDQTHNNKDGNLDRNLRGFLIVYFVLQASLSLRHRQQHNNYSTASVKHVNIQMLHLLSREPVNLQNTTTTLSNFEPTFQKLGDLEVSIWLLQAYLTSNTQQQLWSTLFENPLI